LAAPGIAKLAASLLANIWETKLFAWWTYRSKDPAEQLLALSAVRNSTGFLNDFFRRTKNQFSRFNYLGEWHSHGSLPALPSGEDIARMQAIVEDEPDSPLFAVLLVVCLHIPRELELSALAFRPGHMPTSVQMQVVARSPHDQSPSRGQRSLWRRVFWRQSSDVTVRFTQILFAEEERK